MGGFEHHRHCGQLWFGEDVGGHGDCQIIKPALGGHSRNGIIDWHFYSLQSSVGALTLMVHAGFILQDFVPGRARQSTCQPI